MSMIFPVTVFIVPDSRWRVSIICSMRASRSSSWLVSTMMAVSIRGRTEKDCTGLHSFFRAAVGHV
jgi:hypothetical protein